ncbi:MAG: redoxin domain-containing protein [Planctomycetes bacterium]|nr:redoxin domain-containing protein [Planctomycetota bacterium]
MFVIDAAGKLAYAGAHQDESGASLVAPALADLAAGRAVATPRTKPFGCGVKYEAKAKLGQVAPDFTLTDYAGAEHRLSDLRGKLVVLEWFNPGCPVVKAAHEGGALEGAAARATANGVAWLAINSGAPGKQGATREENTSAAERWKLTHPILADPEGKVGRAYDAKTTPQMVVLDERGVIVYAGAHQDQSGATHYVDQALAELRAGKPVSVPQTRSFGCGVKYAK